MCTLVDSKRNKLTIVHDSYTNYNALLPRSNVGYMTKDNRAFNNDGDRKVPQEKITSKTDGAKHPFRRKLPPLFICSYMPTMESF